MEHFVNFGWVVLGLVMLYYGAEWLVRGASELAIRFGISPLVVGLTVVAFGTSAPELVVSVKANLDGQGGMAIGNIVGSNICNLALVLGVGAMIFPLAIERQVILREMPILLGVSVIFLVMMMDGVVGFWEALVLVVGILWYVVSSLRAARCETVVGSADVPEEVIEAAKTGGTKRVMVDVGLILVGVVVLVIGADRMVFGGANLARAFGVPEAVIGLTLLAFGTSLPELATSVVAAMKKEGEIIVGNAVGSCIFNILAVIGAAGLVAPLVGEGITAVHLWVMMGVTVLLMPMMWHRRNLNRWEGGFLVVGYLGFMGWLFL